MDEDKVLNEEELMQIELQSLLERMENVNKGTEEYQKLAQNAKVLTDAICRLRDSDSTRFEIERTRALEEIKAEYDENARQAELKEEKKKNIFGLVGDLLKAGLLIAGQFVLTHYLYNQEDLEGKFANAKSMKIVDLMHRVKL